MHTSSSSLSRLDPALLLKAAEDFGTPTYVYSERIVREQCAKLRRHLEGIPTRLLYAMKANDNPAILRIMLEEGLGIDAVSPGELHLARAIGFPPDRILFSANNMTDVEMHEAHSEGVLLNIGELSRLEKFGVFAPGSAVCIRVNPQVGGGHHEHVITAGEQSKFGVPVEEIGRVKEIARRHDLEIRGLHQHIGSGILNTEILWKAMQVLLDAAESFPDVRFLNFGGGLGIAYRPDERELDLENFRAGIVDPLQEFMNRHPSDELTFWFEPGRFLTAQAGVLLARVNTLKSNRSRCFAGTDSGMGHLVRPAIYGAYHEIANLSNPEGALRTYDVTGNICEAGDVFARGRPVQEIREDDVLAILDAGAYGMAMASEYNLRPLPAEVLMTDAGEVKLIRRRGTVRELVERMLAATDEAWQSADA